MLNTDLVQVSNFHPPGNSVYLEEQSSGDKVDNMSLAEIKSAIKQLSFEQRAELAARLHGRKDDEWHPPSLRLRRRGRRAGHGDS